MFHLAKEEENAISRCVKFVQSIAFPIEDGENPSRDLLHNMPLWMLSQERFMAAMSTELGKRSTYPRCQTVESP